MAGRVALAVAIIAAGVAAACGGDGTDRADQVRDAGADAGLSVEVQDFLALLVEGPDATFQATYEATGGAGDREFTVIQAPPDRRIDVAGEDGNVDTTLLTDGVTYQCRQESGAWSCVDLGHPQDTSDLPFDPAAMEAAADNLRAAATQYDFEIEPRTIAGVEARCLVTTLKPGNEEDTSLGRSGTLCVSPDGATLLVERPGETVEATRFSTSIPDDSFVLPAEPTTAGTS